MLQGNRFLLACFPGEFIKEGRGSEQEWAVWVMTWDRFISLTRPRKIYAPVLQSSENHMAQSLNPIDVDPSLGTQAPRYRALIEGYR